MSFTMLAIDTRSMLGEMLAKCSKCSQHFYDNVAVIADESGLSDDQVEQLIIYMSNYHGEHV